MMKRSGFYPRLVVDADGGSAVGQAGGVLLTGAVRASGLDVALSAALAPWRARFATHDPAKVLLDLAVTLALGGDACSDLATVRAEPAVFGQVASDPTASRTLARLAGDADKVLTAIDGARAAARARVWDAAGANAPDHDRDARRPLVIDLDATLVTAHSEKENAAPTFKRGFGFHPLCAFVDHGPQGTGEPLSIHLRPGNAGSNTAADHLQVITSALAQIPGPTRGKSVLVRIDGAGGSRQVIEALTRRRPGLLGRVHAPGTQAARLVLPHPYSAGPPDDALDRVRSGLEAGRVPADRLPGRPR
ncbi:transposase [Cellulomonas fimi]|uniref:Transposase n=1 Tax=Cellulomonas fimi TaxID=1708 RepID=A0A7Y0LWE1_CELFI|nr:transposase [Cellulomonas fimi]